MEVCAPPNSGAPENRLIATFDFRHVRETSLVQAERLGYPTNPSLPLMEGDLMLRNAPDVAKRMLCLSATVAAACGFPRDEAIEWLDPENLGHDLSESEVAFLRGTGDLQRRISRFSAFSDTGEIITGFSLALRMERGLWP